MWYIKQAANKVTKLSQNIFKPQTQQQKQIKDIISSRHHVMPINQMSKIANNSFDIQKFQNILEFVFQKLKDIKFEKKSLKKRLNLLVLVTYLIKYGVSGFIDQFRSQINIFESYQHLILTNDLQASEKGRYIGRQIKDRARYIILLLTDKLILAKQKQIARMIRQKIALQGGDFSKHHNSIQNNEEKKNKVQSFMEHYIWRYVTKIDKKLDKIADSIIQKLDVLLDGQIPQNFEIDEIDQQIEDILSKTQLQLQNQKIKNQQLQYIEQKLPIVNVEQKIIVQNCNLLQMQISQLQIKTQKQQQIQQKQQISDNKIDLQKTNQIQNKENTNKNINIIQTQKQLNKSSQKQNQTHPKSENIQISNINKS